MRVRFPSPAPSNLVPTTYNCGIKLFSWFRFRLQDKATYATSCKHNREESHSSTPARWCCCPVHRGSACQWSHRIFIECACEKNRLISNCRKESVVAAARAGNQSHPRPPVLPDCCARAQGDRGTSACVVARRLFRVVRASVLRGRAISGRDLWFGFPSAPGYGSRDGYSTS